jgi:hypothetical protein
VEGIVFASKWESEAYKLLKLLIGKDKFTLQPTFEIQPGFRFEGKAVRAIKYVGDFLIPTKSGEDLVVDTKGMETDVFRIKEKMFKFKFEKSIIKLKRKSQLVDFIEKLKENKEI